MTFRSLAMHDECRLTCTDEKQVYIKEREAIRHPSGVVLFQEISKCESLHLAEFIMAVQK